MEHHGIPEKIISMVQAVYEPSTCQVIHNGTLTELSTFITGVRQWCLLSPFLFLIAMDWIMTRTTEGHKRGVQWSLFKQLEDIDFADDVALLSHRHSDLEEKITEMSNEAENLDFTSIKEKQRC